MHSLIAKIAQLVEHDLAKVGVAGSSPVFRSKIPECYPGFFCGRKDLLDRKRFLFYDHQHFNYFYHHNYARVVELVDTQDLKSCGHCGRAGSIPAPGTQNPL